MEGDQLMVFAERALPEPRKEVAQAADPATRTVGKRTGARPPNGCLWQRTGSNGIGMATATGLTERQISRAMRRHLPRTKACLSGHPRGTYRMDLEIDVACTGKVTAAYMYSRGALSKSEARCVEDVFKKIRFPAHDMPKGLSFALPLTVET